jgi:hypothetical protein
VEISAKRLVKAKRNVFRESPAKRRWIEARRERRILFTGLEG